MGNIGRYAYVCKAGSLITMKPDRWLSEMERGSESDTEHPITERQRTAWLDSFYMLRSAVKKLPVEYHSLDVVFEYTLPQHCPGGQNSGDDRGIRADAILISSRTVMVLEFKQRDDIFIGYVRQTRKYRTRIQKYHRESLGMNKKAILVLTRGKEIRVKYSKVSVRSGDLLAEGIQELFECAPEPHRDISVWLASAFLDRGVEVSAREKGLDN